MEVETGEVKEHPTYKRIQEYVQEKYGVNHMACVCAIDRATLPPLADYWAPGVTVSGVHELVANALVMKGECKRTMDLRQEDLPNVTAEAEEE